MKKIFLTIIAALFATTGFSQSTSTIGPKVSVNFSKFTFNIEELKSNMEPGFDIGLFARVGAKVYLQPELIYSLKSTNLSEIRNEIENIKSSSVDLPILLGYKIIDSKSSNLRLFVGPRFSFVVKDNFKDTFNSASFSFSGQAGVGIDLLMFTLDFRYDYSFTKAAVYNDNNLNGRIYFNTFLISLGWKIL